MEHDPSSSAELNIVLLLDLARENQIPESLVLAQLPADAADRHVLRLSRFCDVRPVRGTPDRWPSTLTAIERMLHDARAIEPDRPRRYWVAGRAGLPAFFYLGHRLSKKAAVTVINPREHGALDVLPLERDDAPDPHAPTFFTCSAWPERATLDDTAVALIVAAGDHHISRDDVADTMATRGTPAHLVEAQTSTWLGRAELAAATHELVERIAGIQRHYPRSHSLGVFIAGPVTLAFLVGRLLNSNIFPNIQVFDYPQRRYRLAFATQPPPRPHPILFLAASPSNTSKLQIEHEAQRVQDELNRSQYPDHFAFVARLAPRVMELRRLLKEVQPTIVHFSGHGREDRLAFVRDDGTAALASPDDVDHLFELGAAPIKLIVLSACSSEAIAERLLARADCVIGMRWPIADAAAIRFAAHLFGALGDGESIQTAFEVGCRAIHVGDGRRAGNDNDLEIPQLKVRPGVDASALILIPARD